MSEFEWQHAIFVNLHCDRSRILFLGSNNSESDIDVDRYIDQIIVKNIQVCRHIT